MGRSKRWRRATRAAGETLSMAGVLRWKRQRVMRERPKEKREEGGRRGEGARQFLVVAVAAPADKLWRKNAGEEEVLGWLGWRRSRRGVAAVAGRDLVGWR